MPVKNFCYCIGGTGTRVAEVAGHLCAMNMVGEQDITFIVVDKDTSCGGTAQALRLLETVTVLSDVNNNPGIAIIRPDGAQKEFCKSTLNVDNWDFSDTLASLTGQNGTASLETSLSSNIGLAAMQNDARLFDAFYSEKEQGKDTQEGFYGHPSIGALIFKYMIEKGGWNNNNQNANNNQNNDIAAPIKDYLINNPADAVKVFIIGSVFGGTGASIFSNLAAHIRKSINPSDNNRVFISGSLLLPYFTFAAQTGGYIDPTEFYSKSRVALDQYGQDPNLMKTTNNPNGSFDSLYICGQEPLHCTAEKYSEGGAAQKNHFNLVDLVAAQAMVQFFNADLALNPQGNNQYNFSGYKPGVYEYRFDSANISQVPTLASIDLSNTKYLGEGLKGMTVFCAYFITKVYASVKLDNPRNSFVLNRIFTKAELQNYAGTATQNQVDGIIDRIYGYCCSFVSFMTDIAKNGHDWSGGQLASLESSYNLFNSAYFDQLNKVIEALNQGNSAAASAIVNQTFALTTGIFNKDNGLSDYIAGANGLTVNEVENKLADLFKGKADAFYRRNTLVNARVGDIIHEAFKYCYNHA